MFFRSNSLSFNIPLLDTDYEIFPSNSFDYGLLRLLFLFPGRFDDVRKSWWIVCLKLWSYWFDIKTISLDFVGSRNLVTSDEEGNCEMNFLDRFVYEYEYAIISGISTAVSLNWKCILPKINVVWAEKHLLKNKTFSFVSKCNFILCFASKCG